MKSNRYPKGVAMFVVAYVPETNEVVYSRRMGPREVMNARKFADLVADMYCATVSEPNGHIPSCSGDIRIEFRPRKNDDLCIWSGESFYFDHE